MTAPLPTPSVTSTIVSVVQFAAQVPPAEMTLLPEVTQCTHLPPCCGLHTASLAQANCGFGPPTQTPAPWQSLSAAQGVPALVPPMHVPPTSQSSRASSLALPQTARGQPLRALFTAPSISSTEIVLSQLLSPGMHCDTSAMPRAMFTVVKILSTVTLPDRLQSPMQPKAVLQAARVGCGRNPNPRARMKTPRTTTLREAVGCSHLSIISTPRANEAIASAAVKSPGPTLHSLV